MRVIHNRRAQAAGSRETTRLPPATSGDIELPPRSFLMLSSTCPVAFSSIDSPTASAHRMNMRSSSVNRKHQQQHIRISSFSMRSPSMPLIPANLCPSTKVRQLMVYFIQRSSTERYCRANKTVGAAISIVRPSRISRRSSTIATLIVFAILINRCAPKVSSGV